MQVNHLLRFFDLTSDWVLMLDKVHDLSIKSWDNFCGPDEPFNRVNLLFGQNGQGKSALATGIRNEIIRSTGSPDSVRFFDREYAQREMSLAEVDGIRGVKVSFAKQNVDTEKELEDLNAELASVNASIDGAKDELKTAESAIRQRVDEIFTTTKGSTNIRAKKAGSSPHELVKAWEDDYNKISPRFSDIDFSSHVADNKADLAIEALEGVALPALPEFDSSSIEVAMAVLGRSYKSVDIPAPVVISWIEQGVRLSEGLDRCPFCGSTMSLADIRSRVEGYQKNEVVGAQRMLGELKDRIKDYSDYVANAKSRGLRALSLLPSDSVDPVLRGWLDSDSSDYSRACNLIDDKIGDMDSIVDLDSHFFEFIREDLEQAGKLRDAIAVEIARQAEIRDNLALITRASVGFKIGADQSIANSQAMMRNEGARINQLEGRAKELKDRIKELKESKIDVSAFANYLSEVLVDLGLPFTLETHRDEYYYLVLSGSHDDGDHLTLRDISEGERNLLALLFFFYTLFTDEEQSELGKQIQTIVIDDPIASMDNMNRFYVLELIRHIMRTGDAQVFVFTHSWNDFCELAYKRPDDMSLFEVVKREGVSLLAPCKSDISPYQKLFKEIYLFSIMRESDDAFEEAALHMPNVMRRVLEEYLSFNCGVASVGSGNIQAIGESLFPGEAWSKVSKNQKGRLSLLLTVTNLFSHRVGDKHDATTVQKCARFMMTRIEAANYRHYCAMKQ